MLNIGGDVAGGGEKKTREAEIANFAVSLDGVGFLNPISQPKT